MIKFTNGYHIDKDFNLSRDDVYVEGSKIVAIGNIDNNNDTQEYNLNGNLLMPGFKNAHTHSPMTFARTLADGLPLQKWLNEMIFPLEAKMNGDDIYKLSKVAFLEYLTSGTTACFDMYYFPEEMAKASTEIGFKTIFVPGLNDFRESLESIENDYKKYHNYNDYFDFQLGFHAEYTTSLENLKGVAKLAEKYHAPVFMHSSETKSEVDGCIERYGKTPTKLFDELGIFNYGGAGYHSVWLSDEDIEIYKNKNIWAVINAGSNCKLASGIAPVQKFIENDINIAIGTDGPSSNNALNMFREMYLICALQKIQNQDPSIPNPINILKSAISDGARCMCLNDCDSIDIGKKADLTVIDLHAPNMQPINSILENLVYSGSNMNVIMTMINGKILYENGEFIGIDKEKIYKEAQDCLERIK